MSWAFPTAAFALIALLCALAPTAPGPWFDKVLHIFGIGSVSARRAALTLWILSTIACAGAGAMLDHFTNLTPVLVAIDAAAIGLAFSFVIIKLASPKGRGTSLID